MLFRLYLSPHRRRVVGIGSALLDSGRFGEVASLDGKSVAGRLLNREKGTEQFAAVPADQADMRVLLRQIRSGMLLQDEDRWTANPERARSFKHSAEAMDFARKKRLKEVEVLLTFETPRFEVGLPLP